MPWFMRRAEAKPGLAVVENDSKCKMLKVPCIQKLYPDYSCLGLLSDATKTIETIETVLTAFLFPLFELNSSVTATVVCY